MNARVYLGGLSQFERQTTPAELALLAIYSTISFALCCAAYLLSTRDLNFSFVTHLSFCALTIVHLLMYLTRNNASLADAVVITFNFLFAIVAPALQLLNDDSRLVNTTAASDGEIALANLIFCALLLAYLADRLLHWPTRLPRLDEAIDGRQKIREVPPPGALGTAICIAIAVVTIGTAKFRIGEGATTAEEIVAPMQMISNKFFYFLSVPVAIIMAMAWARRSPFTGEPPRKIGLAISLIFLACLVVSQNPLVEKRNSLGPVYLTFLFCIAGLGQCTTRIRLLLFVLAPTIVMMPVAALFTHSTFREWGATDRGSLIELIVDHFTSVHYDAWANTVTVVQMVKDDSVRFGRQLVGSALFFVPHEWWSEKPITTGMEIGNYLIKHHFGWFNNLSAPLPAEAYIDFGILGCLGYGVILSRVVGLLDRHFLRPQDTAAFATSVYMSFFLIFALRGALMNAFAYATGNLLAFAVVRLFLLKTSKPESEASGVRLAN